METKQKPTKPKPDTTVLCKTCGNTEEIVFIVAMRNGWPTCHNEGMHLDESTADIQADIRTIMGLSYRNFSHTRRIDEMKKEVQRRANLKKTAQKPTSTKTKDTKTVRKKTTRNV